MGSNPDSAALPAPANPIYGFPLYLFACAEDLYLLVDIEKDLEDAPDMGNDDIKHADHADGGEDCGEIQDHELFIGKVLYKTECKPVLKCIKMERMADGNMFMSLFGEIIK